MKKRRPSWPEIVFWCVVVAGFSWVFLAPHPKPRHAKPHAVAVAPPTDGLVPKGDELSLTEPPPLPPLVESETPKPQIPAPPPGQKAPRIAIVIDDMGLDLANSRRALTLPPTVTLSFIPYATRLHDQTKAARTAGHELLLHMPMEPVGSANPGPGALLTGLTPDELRLRLDTALASFTGFDGVNNHMGSKFTADRSGMELVMDELQPRHIFFFDSMTSAKSVGARVATERSVPTITRDVFLDDDQTPKLIARQLDAAEHIARRKGYAVAIGHPHPATLDALESWLPEAEKRGVVFVPLKSLVAPSANNQ